MEESAIAQLLEASLDHRQNNNKKAELELREYEKKPNYSVYLLRIVANEPISITTRLSGALAFKNFIKRKWADEDGKHRLPQKEVEIIKQELVGLMISTPPNIQSQLGDSIGIIADSDFWEWWDTLVDDLVSRLTSDNTAVNNGVLQVAHSIFKRWRPLYRSDELFTEINHVLERFGSPFVALLQSTDNLIESSKTDTRKLSEAFTTLNLMIKLFFDLSCQDLPPIFEDNLTGIATFLQKYLSYDLASLYTDSDEESGVLEFVKAGIFELLSLYVMKYEDAFGPHVDAFVGSSWNLLTTIGPETKYDILVSKALQFLTSVTRIERHATAFNNQDTLAQVIEKVILPNLALRDSDMELFEDEPIEFIRRDLEGSDSDTRRRAATDFLRGLMAQYEALVTEVVLKYITHYLSDYSKDPENNWKSKDTAIYLYSSIAAKGTITASQGVKSTNPHVNILEFFNANVANDLVSVNNEQPMLEVDAIKYLYIFRSLISKEEWQTVFPLLVNHLGSSNFVVYSYAAIAVERVLALTDDSHQAIIGKTQVAPVAPELLEHLFKLIEKDVGSDKTQAAAKIQENEFLMRCVMRVLIVLGDSLIPLTETILQHFVGITEVIAVNPSNPRFYYYHFEALGAIIRFAGPTQSLKIETSLFPPFFTILRDEIQEFIPYVLQLFAALLEADTSNTLSDLYKQLIPGVLRVEYWGLKGNVPALVRLLSSLITRAAPDMVANDQLEAVLGAFQRLIEKKTTEIFGFELLEAILTYFPLDILRPYIGAVINLLLTRLQNSKTEAFSSRFVRLYHFISAKDDAGLGADFFIDVTDQIQASVYTPLYLSIILPETKKLARPLDRKTAVISLTKTLIGSKAFAERYVKGWGFTCEALLQLLENPPLPSTIDDLIIDHDVDDMSFGVGFTQLNTIKKPPRDFWPEVTDVKRWVSSELKTADVRQMGKISSFAQARLSPEAQQALAPYMQS